MKTVYVCSDTVTGIFSAVYDAWRAGTKAEERGIALRDCLEMELFCDYVQVEETERKAAAVDGMIRKNLGLFAYRNIYQAVLAASPNF